METTSVIVNLKCFFKGHTQSKINDDVCDRCGKHWYYDDPDYNPNVKWYQSAHFTFGNLIGYRVRLLWGYIKWNIGRRIIDRCNDCNKPYSILGRKTKHDHSNCLPF